ncbi:MAG: hypothetical protein K6U74_04190 [Firmicutes bacterium]|nr:hypothetical protein [Bacillota bacterium]
MLCRAILRAKERTGRISRFTRVDAERVLELRRKFRPGGKITTGDILEALRIIQHEAAVLAVKNKDGYGALELLGRCVIAMLEDGKLELPAETLAYIAVTMPFKPFARLYLEEIQE